MPSSPKDRVALGMIQMSCSENAEENLDKAITRIREIADSGAQVICLQELFRTPYMCQEENHDFFDLAEPIPGPTTDRLSQVAKEKGVALVTSHFEKRAPGLYHNTACVFDVDGSLLGTYRKMHIPDDPHYYEKFYFTPGDKGFKVFDTKFGRLGTLVCWDQWYPEGARLTALRGAQILFYPTAIGYLHEEKEQYGERQHSSWETIQRGHAIANGVYVCAVNRVGSEGNIEFWGQSFVADPQGIVIKRGSATEEQNLIVEVNLKFSETVRQHWPFLRDRRIDAYGDITKRFIDE